MYAILVEDRVSEKNAILSTLAADPVAAAMLMITTATAWCERQPVNLGYEIQPGAKAVSVLSGKEVVLALSLTSINGVVGAIPDDVIEGADSKSVH